MSQRPAHPRHGAPRRLVTLAALAAIVVSSTATAQVAAPDSVQLLQRLAAQGSTDAELQLGVMYVTGQGVDQDYGQALKWFARVADQGDPRGKAALIGSCAQPLVPTPAACLSAAADIRAAAARSDPQAEVDLGSFYFAGGGGLAKDPATALTWYHKSADQGYTRAEVQLGFIYGTGQFGIAADPEQAMSWFRKAADQGDFNALQTVAAAYEDGRYGIAQDPVQAAAWYLKGANAGDPFSQYTVATKYAVGEGVPEDHVLAVYWYRKSAEQGSTTAAVGLATAYAGGKGVARDDFQAYLWMTVAIEQLQAATAHAPGGPGQPLRYWVIIRDTAAARLNRSRLADADGQAAAFMARLAGRDKAQEDKVTAAFGF